ncbi:hypothetical protein [Algiphilus aromaticivorans]|uniref:hypothetical protein n=1 Tax=Algiphilus aromaticivorans TaxID=382454 RepID=UPI0005C1FF42|nr:hypothetical protein [Algiphilus aromaticivorans]
MTLLQLTFFIFLALALGGVLMACLILLKYRVPRALSNGHGLLALVALAIFLAANLTADNGALAWWAFGVLAAGFLGGGFLFRFLFRDRAPIKLIAGHAALGVTGLALLGLSAF